MAKELPRFKYLDRRHVVSAVFYVYLDTCVFEGLSKRKANSQSWLLLDELRKDLHDRTRTRWAAVAGKDRDWFPYSAEYVCRLYAWIQSLEDDALDAWLAELGLEDPRKDAT